MGNGTLDPATKLVDFDKCNKHTCEVDEDELKTILFRTQLKNRVKTCDDELIDIYNQLGTVFGANITAKIPFERVRSNLFDIRRRAKEKKRKEESEVEQEVEQAGASGGASGSQKTRRSVCDICTDVITGNPVINIPCGHGFCAKCSKLSLIHSNKCAHCRSEIHSTVPFYNS